MKMYAKITRKMAVEASYPIGGKIGLLQIGFGWNAEEREKYPSFFDYLEANNLMTQYYNAVLTRLNAK